MNCKWCGNVVGENDKFCQHCGGNLMNTNVSENPQVSNATMNQSIQTNTEAKANIWLVILSVFIPLAGLIIFLVKKDDDKKTAKASGLAALISFCVSIILFIVSIVFILTVATNSINSVFDKAQNAMEDIETEMNNNGYDTEDLEDAIDDFKDKTDDFIDKVEDLNITNMWNNYEFSLNNQVIKLPCSYSDLGFKMKSAEEMSYISPNYYTLVNLYKNDNLALYIELLNDTEEDILYTNAKVTRISQTQYQASTGADIVTFPGGLQVGQEITKEAIINLLGTPNDINNYESDGYISDTYSYFEDTFYTTTNYYKIKVVNGVIDELTLDHRNYE